MLGVMFAIALGAIHSALASSVIVNGSLTESSNGDIVGYKPDVAYCSGDVIGKRGRYLIVVTARHCVDATLDIQEDGSSVVMTPLPAYVQFFDGSFGRVIKSRKSKTDDVGFLTVEAIHQEPQTTIRLKPMERGEPAFVVGDALGRTWTYSEAYSSRGDMPPSSGDAVDGWLETLTFACSTCGPGDSGGGVFDADGMLAGIVVGGDGSGAMLIEPSRVILREFLEAV